MTRSMQIKSLLRLVALLLAIPLLAGCASLRLAFGKKDAQPESEPQGPRLVGRIASVPADHRFVLIQSYGKWTIEPGTILTTRGEEERTANLKVTGEQLGQFAAADVQSGTVVIGDAVYSRHVPKPPEPAQPTQEGGGSKPPNAQPGTPSPATPAESTAPVPDLPLPAENHS